MYTATMQYQFKDEAFDPRFVRMQFLTARPKALAIGTWEDTLHARAFMETGAFKTLMGKLQSMVAGQPEQAIWDLKYYASK